MVEKASKKNNNESIDRDGFGPSTVQDEVVLELKNLQTHFTTKWGTVKACDGVSYSVRKGETLGIVGESGSGKSVTALSIMRLIQSPPGLIAGGEVILNGRNILELSEKEMTRVRGGEISMILQDPMQALNPVFDINDQVGEAIGIHQGLKGKSRFEKVVDALRKVRIPAPDTRAKDYPHQLSGGMRQRVVGAIGISSNPSVIIADEPTTSLDVTIQAAYLRLLKQIQAETGAAIIFITHDLGVIAELADKVVVMYKGKIVEQGNVWDIFTKPKHPYTKGLLACRPPLNKRYKFLPTVSDFMQVDCSGNVIDNKISVNDFTKKIIVSDKERKERLANLYQQDPILQVQNLKTYFPIKKGFFGGTSGYVKAVDNISFDVYPKETLGLVGESGCGKTTTGRTILRLEEPISGKMIYKGIDIASMSANELRDFRKEVQIIFQDPYSSLNPRMTIGNAIMEPMQVHNILNSDEERKEKVKELLTKVSLDPSHFYRYPHEFSGGQRQRIGIARALAVNPKFIICDESVSALDVSVQAQVLNLLNDLKDEFGLTYIFISHDLSVVKYMSDRMVVMQEGKIEEMDDADKIYNSPETEYTLSLIHI